MAPSGPRQEAKLVVCLYKMLTTSLTVLIFGSGKYRDYSQQNYACACRCASCYVCCIYVILYCYVFSCTLHVSVQSARYDSPNNLSLLPADTQHNNTKPTLIT